MENEIKVGEYIRTKDGVIAKVTYVDGLMIDTDNDVFDLDNLSMMEIPVEYANEYIVKHSPELLDLIKAEDTIKIKIGLYTSFVHFIVDEDDLISIKAQIEANFWTIDKIYTKEMMESISYKVTKMCKTYIKVVRKM